MAFTERYVTSSAGGGGSGTSGSPWTFAEAVAAAAPLDRINIQSDAAYSIGATSLPSGTLAGPIHFRGYDTTIGDLDGQADNADGTINTTNFPAVTITGAWTPGAYMFLQNLNITGALSTFLVGSTGFDNWGMVRCKVVNSQNNAAARAIQCDDKCLFVNSDFHCSGAAHAAVASGDANCSWIGCRFRTTSTSACLEHQSGPVRGCVFFGNAASTGIHMDAGWPFGIISFDHNTFYGIGTCIEIANIAPGSIPTVMSLLENHATDCSKWVDNLYSATAIFSTVELRNRLRDITTPRSGVEAIIVDEITTDTGGPETDYVDVANRNFTLIPTAPGYRKSFNGTDIGALHAASAGSGGLLVHGGMSGGMRG